MKHSLIKAILYAIFLLLLFLLFAFLFSQGTSNDMDPNPLSDVNKLERGVEMGRHDKLIAVKGNRENTLAEFVTDGCSGGLSVGWEYLADNIADFQKTHGTKPPWESCCISHDRAYHSAGIRSATATMSFEARREADLVLKACVVETGVNRRSELMKEYNISATELDALYNGIARMMYGAVRVGGMPCTDLSWRWGYGWPACN